MPLADSGEPRALREVAATATGEPPPKLPQEVQADPAKVWRFAARAAPIGIFVILLIGALVGASAVLLPVVCALVLGLAMAPLTDRVTRFGGPPFLTAAVVAVLVLLIVVGLVMLVAAPMSEWIDRLPEIGTKLRGRLAGSDGPLTAIRELRRALEEALGGGGQLKVELSGSDFLSSAVAAAVPTATHALLFFGTLFFLIGGRPRLKRRLVVMFVDRDARLATLKILNDVERSLARYFGTVTAVTLALGLVTGLAMAARGMPSPPLWGAMAAVFNYVPFIGPTAVTTLLALAGLGTFPDLVGGLLPAAVFVGIILLEGQVITPHVVGRRMTMPPLAVFLAIAFWAWVWGPLGAFVAVPLMVIATVIVAHLFPSEELSLPG